MSANVEDEFGGNSHWTGQASQSLRNFVDGQFTHAAQGAVSDVVNLSTGETYAHAPVSDATDVDAALRAAARAFETWRYTTPAERSLAPLRFAGAIEARAGDLVAAESRNTGKPIELTRTDEVPPLADELRFFAGAARMLDGRSAGEYLAEHTSMIRREPIGVCAQVTPRNTAADSYLRPAAGRGVLAEAALALPDADPAVARRSGPPTTPVRPPRA